MGPFARPVIQAAYDAVASDYAREFGDDLTRLPVDREFLDAVALGSASGILADLGCGPAVMGSYLADTGRTVVGLDLSPAMLAVAARRDERLLLLQGDLARLPIADGSCAGGVAYYCIQHLPRAELPHVLAELRRTIAPDGLAALATHLGVGEVVTSDFLGHRITPAGGTLYSEAELEAAVRAAGFAIERSRRRHPLPNEHATERLYLLLRKSAQSEP
ncbi:MAG TPA: methyltransferase domain-containing protein [Mycobacteriales bacterium]|nr:methyltransferase domain-containing protein [Mycobacteriales bacterium]